MLADYRDRCVLVTGGTAGIGLGIALAFAGLGARCVLTCRWGSADEEALRARFAALGAPEPLVVESDAAHDGETRDLVARIAREHDRVDVFVSNVAFAQLVHGVEDYGRRGLVRSLEYSTWPLLGTALALREGLGHWPRYVVALSSRGHLEFHGPYDFAAASKAALEALVAYLAQRLAPEGVRVNAVRPRFVDTASLSATMGEGFAPAMDEHGLLQTPEEVGDAVLALCSGLLDGMTGQVLDVDRGTAFSDTLQNHFDHQRAGAAPAPPAPHLTGGLPRSEP